MRCYDRARSAAQCARQRGRYERKSDVIKEKVREYRAANPEKARASKQNAAKKRRARLALDEAALEAQRVKQREANKVSRLKHLEKRRTEDRAYYARIKGKKKAYRDAHKDRSAEVERAWRQGPGKIRCLEKAVRRRSTYAAAGAFLPEDWEAVLECYGHRCRLCAGTERITPDHIVPLSKGGTNQIDNFQPLCVRCNSTKGARNPWPWLQSVVIP